MISHAHETHQNNNKLMRIVFKFRCECKKKADKFAEDNFIFRRQYLFVLTYSMTISMSSRQCFTQMWFYCYQNHLHNLSNNRKFLFKLIKHTQISITITSDFSPIKTRSFLHNLTFTSVSIARSTQC